MDPDAFLSPEVGAAVALTALMSNPRVRSGARTVLVRGLALTLSTAEAIKGFAIGVNPVPAAQAAVTDLGEDIEAEQQHRRTRKTAQDKHSTT